MKNNGFTIVSLEHISKARKKLILEAMSFKKRDDAKKKGWKYLGSGVYKSAFKKKNVVVKFSTEYYQSSCGKEAEMYNKVKPAHKKYFARIYAFKDGISIQEYIKHIEMSQRKFKKLDKVLRKYEIIDYNIGHNIGIRSSLPVIFDYMTVY